MLQKNEDDEKVDELFTKYRRVSPELLMRNFHINFDSAFILCNKKWLERWKQARVFMKEYEDRIAR